MIRKREAWQKAMELRKRGFTYVEIAKYVGASKGTVSNWLSHESWSKKVRDDNTKRAARDNAKRISLLNTARGNQNRKLYAEAERGAATEFKHYKHSPLFIAGLMAYVALGDHTHTAKIRLSSARMEAHRVFVRFAQEYLGVPREKVHFWLILYPSMDEERCIRAWSRKIGLNIGQFHKTQVIKSQSTRRTLQYGVGNTVINSALQKKRLLKWVSLFNRKTY